MQPKGADHARQRSATHHRFPCNEDGIFSHHNFQTVTDPDGRLQGLVERRARNLDLAVLTPQMCTCSPDHFQSNVRAQTPASNAADLRGNVDSWICTRRETTILPTSRQLSVQSSSSVSLHQVSVCQTSWRSHGWEDGHHHPLPRCSPEHFSTESFVNSSFDSLMFPRAASRHLIGLPLMQLHEHLRALNPRPS